jgi:hypothetical protein
MQLPNRTVDDVPMMSFTASSVAAEWKLNGAQLGLLFGAGHVSGGGAYHRPGAGHRPRPHRRHRRAAGLLLDGGWQPASLYGAYALQLALLAIGTGRAALGQPRPAAAR